MPPWVTYASEVSAERGEATQPVMQSASRRTKPATVEIHQVFYGVQSMLLTGCQWGIFDK